MRTIIALSLISLFCFSANVNAQSNPSAQDSYISIQKLADSRVNFNKALIKSRTVQNVNLPKPCYIFNQNGLHTVNIEGLNFTVNNNTIVGIEEIPLSKAALNMINERLIVLDKMQYAYSESSNQEYLSGVKNRYASFNSDRQFFSILKNLKSTINQINKLSKDANNPTALELKLAQWKQPSIDWAFFSQIVNKEAKTQLAK